MPDGPAPAQRQGLLGVPGPFPSSGARPRQWADAGLPLRIDRRVHAPPGHVSTRKLIIAAVLTGAAILAAGITQIVLGRAGH